MQYNKPPISIPDQAQLLLARGLHCDNRQRMESYLSNIGFYRLSAYFLPFEKPSTNGDSRNHQFLPGTTFEQVLSLYVLDRKLRLLIMEVLERIEVAVRTRWASGMAMRHGSHVYMNAIQFKDLAEHTTNLAKLSADLLSSKETFVIHYRNKYDDPALPPIWAVVETMTLGSMSRWIASTRDNSVKIDIARALGMPTISLLEQVLHVLTPVRNICAHHSRLWNRRFTMRLPNIGSLQSQFITETIVTPNGVTNIQLSQELYNFLVVIQHLILNINPGTSWGERLAEHIRLFTAEQQQAMGFPADWEQRQPWAREAP